MKTAKDLIIPFDWENRRPICLDRFFYVPSSYEYTPENIPFFDNSQEIMLEYCSGNGQWILEKAASFPHLNWIAVEKKFERARKIWRRMKALSLQNLFVVCSEALVFSRFYAPLIKKAFINFPDPWPKRRHAKHRLVQRPFIEALLRILPEEGEVHTATDDQKYADQMIQEFEKSKSWKLLFFSKDLDHYGDSFFKHLWESMGREIYYTRFVRRHVDKALS